MNMRVRSSPSFLFPLLFVVPVAAQAHDAAPITANRMPLPVMQQPTQLESGLAAHSTLPAPTTPTDFITPIHSAADDPAGYSYGTWAAGADYKVGFAKDVTFIPYLGRDYPTTQSVRWQTVSATAGGSDLLAVPTPTTWHDQDRFEYRYGGLVEAYDVLLGGLEQTFVLSNRPAHSGDIVVRGRVTTTLQGTLLADGAIDFADADGRNLVRYGAATAIDARGDQQPMSTSYADGIVSLTVPAAWLEGATFPVVIDPLLTPVTLQLGVAKGESVDLVRDDSSNTLFNVYARFVSATDADVWGRIYPDGFGAGGGGTLVLTDITTSWSTPTIDCSVCGPQGTYVAAMSREFAAGAAMRIWAQPTTTATVVTAVLFGPFSATAIDWRPTVGGIQAFNESGSAVTGTHCLVAFQRDNSGTPGTNTAESEIWALPVDCTTSPATLGTAFEAASTVAGRDSEMPDLTKISEGGASTSWIIAFQEYNNSIANDDWDALARRITTTTATATEWFPTVSSGDHKLTPKIAGQDGRYCVFYGRVNQTTLTKVSGYDAHNIDCERFDWPTGGTIGKLDASVLGTSSTGTRYLRVYGAAHDTDTNSFWLGLWHANGAGSRNLFLDRVGHRGQRVEGESIPPGSIDYVDGNLDYDDDAKGFVFAYAEDNAAATHPLRGNVFAFPTEVSPSVGGIGCNSVTMTWSATDVDGTVIFANNQQMGHQFTRLSASGGPATGFHLMQLSMDTLDVVVLHPLITPGCRLLVDVFGPGYIGQVSDFGPSVAWNIPLPDTLPGFTLHCQDWIYDLSTNLLTTSTRLSVPLVSN